MGKPRFVRRRRTVSVLLAAALVGAVATAAVAAGDAGDWPFGGQNTSNTRSQDQKAVGVSNAGRLAVKWTAHLGGDVSATPALNNGAVYVPDWGTQDAASSNSSRSAARSRS